MRATFANVATTKELGGIVREVFDHAINPKKDEPKTLLQRAQDWLKKNAVEVTAVTTLGGALGYQTGALPVVASVVKTVATASPGSMTIAGVPVDISLLSASAIGGASYLGLEGVIKCGKVLRNNKLVTGLAMGYLVWNGYTMPILGAVYSSGVWKPLLIGAGVKMARDATIKKVSGKAEVGEKDTVTGVIRDAVIKKASGKAEVGEKDTVTGALTEAALAKTKQAGSSIWNRGMDIWNSRAMTAVRTTAAARWQQAQGLGRRAVDAAKNNLDVSIPATAVAATVVAAGVGLISAPIAAIAAGSVTAGAIFAHVKE